MSFKLSKTQCPRHSQAWLRETRLRRKYFAEVNAKFANILNNTLIKELPIVKQLPNGFGKLGSLKVFPSALVEKEINVIDNKYYHIVFGLQLQVHPKELSKAAAYPGEVNVFATNTKVFKVTCNFMPLSGIKAALQEPVLNEANKEPSIIYLADAGSNLITPYYLNVPSDEETNKEIDKYQKDLADNRRLDKYYRRLDKTTLVPACKESKVFVIPTERKNVTLLRPSESLYHFLKEIEGVMESCVTRDSTGKITEFRPYTSSEGGAKTIGWGHKIKPEEGNKYDNGISGEEGDALLIKDVKKEGTDFLNRKGGIKVPLLQQEYDALVSMKFNGAYDLTIENHINKGISRYDRLSVFKIFFHKPILNNNIRDGIIKRRAMHAHKFIDNVWIPYPEEKYEGLNLPKVFKNETTFIAYYKKFFETWLLPLFLMISISCGSSNDKEQSSDSLSTMQEHVIKANTIEKKMEADTYQGDSNINNFDNIWGEYRTYGAIANPIYGATHSECLSLQNKKIIIGKQLFHAGFLRIKNPKYKRRFEYSSSYYQTSTVEVEHNTIESDRITDLRELAIKNSTIPIYWVEDSIGKNLYEFAYLDGDIEYRGTDWRIHVLARRNFVNSKKTHPQLDSYIGTYKCYAAIYAANTDLPQFSILWNCKNKIVSIKKDKVSVFNIKLINPTFRTTKILSKDFYTVNRIGSNDLGKPLYEKDLKELYMPDSLTVIDVCNQQGEKQIEFTYYYGDLIYTINGKFHVLFRKI